MARGSAWSASLLFAPFRLDLSAEQLWHGAQVIVLRPKTFAVLCYLAEHGGLLVTKSELLDAVWGETFVGDAVLKGCIRELRAALGDEAQTPRYIETVHRRGYRFIAPVRMSGVGSRGSRAEAEPNQAPGIPTPATRSPAPLVVGREAELAQLRQWFDKAMGGERQIVFVTGEPGIGKTTLVDHFLMGGAAEWVSWKEDARAPLPPSIAPVWIGRGQCIEQYGAGEAYLPILEALGRLCREPGGERLITLLDQHAPTWLAQMPGLLDAADLEALQRKVAGARANACCARWGRRSKRSPSSSHWCCGWKICTGAMSPPWSCWPCSHAGVNRRGCW